MATGVVNVTVVDVGQGQCTFVEIYDRSSKPKLIHTLLFDCGTDKDSTQTYKNLDYIAKKALEKNVPGFDCIIFSHSDNDHISLAKYVLDKIWETTKPTVDEVIYGGNYDKYEKKGENILEYIEDEGFCDSDKIYSMNSNATNYVKTSKSYGDNLWHSTDNSVYVYGIVANVLSDDPDWDDNDATIQTKTAEAKNRVSIICGLYYANSSYVICGDATKKTMGAVNNLFSGGTAVFNQNLMTTLPHHGSRATAFGVPSTKGASAAAKLVVTTFSGILKSQTLTASSFEKHSHPSLELMNCFIPTAAAPFLRDPRLKEKNAHRIVANIDIKLTQPKGWSLLKSYYSFDTTTCTFGTRYSQSMTWFFYNLGNGSVTEAKGKVTSGTVINEFACWQYETQTTGNYLVGGYANLDLPLVLFTEPAIASVEAQESIEEAIVIDPGSETIPISVRIKNNLSNIPQPAYRKPEFLNRLKQFQ